VLLYISTAAAAVIFIAGLQLKKLEPQ
jgi:hypothetical protein